jgi:acetyl-CoA acetyltransferase
MSRAPWVMLKPERAFPRGHEQLHSSTLGWRIVNPDMPERWTISLGASAEKLADMCGIAREAQDAFALRSHQRAAAAWDSGFYNTWVAPVPGTELARDGSVRADTTLEKLARLRPAFIDGGTVTAGNSSPLNDGAGAILITDEKGAQEAGRDPLAGSSPAGSRPSTLMSSGSPPCRRPLPPCTAPESRGRTSPWSS